MELQQDKELGIGITDLTRQEARRKKAVCLLLEDQQTLWG